MPAVPWQAQALRRSFRELVHCVITALCRFDWVLTLCPSGLEGSEGRRADADTADIRSSLQAALPPAQPEAGAETVRYDCPFLSQVL